MLKFSSIALFCSLWTSHLGAQTPSYDARTERLAGLTRSELKALEPSLHAGPVALVEFTDNDSDALPGVHVATIVHAPLATLVSVIQKPEQYPRFIGTLDEVEIAARKSDSVVYDWRWQMALLSLQGRNAMTWYPAPADRPDVGYRATIDSQSGDLGQGRISIRVLPRSAQESLLMISMRLDLRSANYVARQLARAARSINRTANMSLTYAMSLGFRHEAERRAGHRVSARSQSALHKPALDTGAVLPLLLRGDLVLLDMSGDALNQVAVFGLVHQPRPLVHEVMLDTSSFGSALMPGSAATVVSREGPLTTFDWDIALPLVGVSGRMTLRDENRGVSVHATEGALEGGRWNFEASKLAKSTTLVAGWADFDLRKSTWFVRALVDADPYLSHGMSAASQLMILRALRSRAAKRAEPTLLTKAQ